jgi:hypothetical protein
MIVHNVIQQSPEWFKMRLGLATASRFSEIITPKEGKYSKSADKYSLELIGEMITGQSAEKFESYWMERGAIMESDAAASYEAITGYTLAPGGFITNDTMTVGASVDRLVLNDQGVIIGGVEIKCPSMGVHLGNLKRSLVNEIDPAYIPQVQGQIVVGEGQFQFIDWFSYHPDTLPALIRTGRDADYCDKIRACLTQFLQQIDTDIYNFKKMGIVIPNRPLWSMSKGM